MIRQFVEFDLDEYIKINKDDKIYHHLVNVLKIKLNKQVAFVNEECYIYEYIEFNSDFLLFKKINKELVNRKLPINITLYTPLLKKDNFELVLQKCSEIGVNNFIPGLSKNSVVKLDENKFSKKVKRYNEILLSAAMQSQRNDVAKISNLTKLTEIDFSKFDLIFCCYEAEEENTIFKYSSNICESKNILMICGPEGGFDKSEIDFLVKQNVKIITLGNTILRAETACICSTYLLAQLSKEVTNDICN